MPYTWASAPKKARARGRTAFLVCLILNMIMCQAFNNVVVDIDLAPPVRMRVGTERMTGSDKRMNRGAKLKERRRESQFISLWVSSLCK